MTIRLLFILFFCQSVTNAQEFVIANSKLNILYVGVNNPISIAVNQYKCKEIKLVLSYGTIEIADNPCDYNISVDKPGKVKLGLYTQADNILIGEVEYRALFMPDPVISEGLKPKKIKRDQLSLSLETNRQYYEEIGDSVNFQVAYFSVMIVRCGQVLHSKEITGSTCDDEVKLWFSKLQTADKVYFEDIESYTPDGILRKMNAIAFTIVE